MALRTTTTALVLMLMLTGCGGNPFAPVVPEPVNPDPPPDVPDNFMPEDAVSGAVEGAELAQWSAGAGVIRVRMDAQVLSGVTGDFARDSTFDVVRDGVTYYGYSFQSTTLNRKAVVLVRGEGSVKAMVAMEPGQFANGAPDMYHSGAAIYRASVFTRPSGGGLFNYQGSYAGLLNIGPAAGAPPGSLAPTEPYKTSGTALVTADFTRMKVSGGVTGRQIVDTGEVLPDIALWTTGISTTGDFSGVVYRGNSVPPGGAGQPQDWTAAGRYDGVFGGSGSEVGIIMLFDPLGNTMEQGMIVAPCTLTSSGACP